VLWFKFYKLKNEMESIDLFLVKELQLPNTSAADYADALKKFCDTDGAVVYDPYREEIDNEFDTASAQVNGLSSS
jgi:hypothetical protein